MMSISTMARSGVFSTISIASLPVVAVSTCMPRRSSTLLKREDVARVVVDQQHGAADQILVRAVEPLEHALLLGRQVGDDAMQEQRGLVEQPLRRLDALHHDAARHGVQLRVLLGRQLAAGEHHDRHVGRATSSRLISSSTSKPVMSGRRRSSTTQSYCCSRRLVSALAAGAGGVDLDVVVAEQLADAHLLGRIVLDHEQPLAARLGVLLDPRDRGLDALGGGRLGDERERAARQRMLAVLVERDDLHRDVAGERILLELAQHRPAEHVGQEHVERHRGRLELLGEIERVDAAHRDQHLEAVVAREVHDDARVMRVVLDDQQDAVARLDLEPVVRDLLGRAFRPAARYSLLFSTRAGASGATRTASDGPTYFSGR